MRNELHRIRQQLEWRQGGGVVRPRRYEANAGPLDRGILTRPFGVALTYSTRVDCQLLRAPSRFATRSPSSRCMSALTAAAYGRM